MFNKDRLRRTIPPVFNFKSAPIYINLAAFVSNFSDFLAVFMPIVIRKALFLMANKSPMFKKASG
ncbi:hypothetical protein N5J50_00960 [Acinetobacter johnsonii]|uniref:Uncharacterized protein n=1 Tax=Acinetobacter johnsonii TaxID=40214 RepID=A0AA43BJX3_ACIJO|nr:hypothetical protein [Acinetobacter johnsonii]MDH2171027.1 hypothetical protein [Acinetobacter johnsonii]MDH2174287.1 hypothetical protein [Acinetobacter johnsonii]QPF33578.1 hypothetical protein H0S57_12765 [Acinetobacter johnsonii]